METEITYCAEQLKKQYGSNALEACRKIIKIKGLPADKKLQMKEVLKILEGK